MIERIARHCGRTHRALTPWLSIHERAEAALDGIVAEIHANGWPEKEKVLFDAGSTEITRQVREPTRHLTRWSFWVEPPGQFDAIGERITDRIAVWQMVWALTDDEWATVWALGEAMRRGEGKATAAALAGMSMTRFTDNLHSARVKCRANWCAPGETVQPYYARRSKIHGAIEKRRQRDRRQAA